MDIRYKIITRNIKNPRLEFKHGDLFVIVPTHGDFDVEAFVARHKPWIEKHAKYYQALDQQSQSLELVDRLSEDFTNLVEQLVASGVKIVGQSPKKLSYKSLRSRWGSCSSAGEIIINLKLRHFPEPLIWYVVFHELVHLRVHAHNKNFYEILSKVFPDYKKYDRLLSSYEYLLVRRTRLPGGR